MKKNRPGLLYRTSAKKYRGLLRIFDKYLKLKGFSEMVNYHLRPNSRTENILSSLARILSSYHKL